MASSDFKVPPQPPPNFNDTPAGLLADTQTLINNTRQLHDQIVASINPSEAAFSSVLLPLIEDHNLAASRRRIFKFYGSTSTSSELRDASHASEILFTEFETETLQREDLFQLVDAIFHRDENLDPESQVYLERQHRAFARNGLKIGAGPQRERFAEIKKELLEKSIAYRKSLNRRAGIWLTATELDGLPDNKMASLTVGEGENAGRLWLPLQKSDADNVWQYVKNGDVRRKIYVSRDNRCLDNVPRLKEIIVLRDESARLLGYRNHAEFSIEEKIAESTSFVNQFIRDLRENLTPRAKDKLGQLLELKRATVKDNSNANDLDPSEFNTLYAWDFGFYNNLTKDKWHSFDENRFSEYFSLERSLTGIMGIFSRIFGLQFFQITRDNYQKFGSEHVMTWHEDVYVYSVWNDDSEGGEFVGYLYLDLFPRDDKFNHAGHYGLQFGYSKLSGERVCPSSALVMNLTAPQPKKPTLLKQDHIRSLFHELGHAIHNLSTRVKYSALHGNLSRDFLEIPSIMLENWCWTPSVIKELGYHYSYISDAFLEAWKESSDDTDIRPNRILDDEMIENLINSRHTNQSVGVLRQCHIGTFDMAIHSPSSHEEAEAMNPSEMWNRLMSEVTMLSGMEKLDGRWDWGHGCARLGALVRGYDAGYYAYPLGKAYAQDLFTAMFENNPMSREVGMRYRKTVLEPGGSRNGMDLLEEFLGRKPNSSARYKELGLLNK